MRLNKKRDLTVASIAPTPKSYHGRYGDVRYSSVLIRNGYAIAADGYVLATRKVYLTDNEMENDPLYNEDIVISIPVLKQLPVNFTLSKKVEEKEYVNETRPKFTAETEIDAIEQRFSFYAGNFLDTDLNKLFERPTDNQTTEIRLSMAELKKIITLNPSGDITFRISINHKLEPVEFKLDDGTQGIIMPITPNKDLDWTPPDLAKKPPAGPVPDSSKTVIGSEVK